VRWVEGEAGSFSFLGKPPPLWNFLSMIYFHSSHSYRGIIINIPYICGVDYILHHKNLLGMSMLQPFKITLILYFLLGLV
jgi:hypothetical protein